MENNSENNQNDLIAAHKAKAIKEMGDKKAVLIPIFTPIICTCGECADTHTNFGFIATIGHKTGIFTFSRS